MTFGVPALARECLIHETLKVQKSFQLSRMLKKFNYLHSTMLALQVFEIVFFKLFHGTLSKTPLESKQTGRAGQTIRVEGMPGYQRSLRIRLSL